MKKIFSVLLALAMVLSLVPAATLAEAAVNNPPAANGWQISTPQDLINFGLQLAADNAIYVDSYAVLMNDIDMAGVSYTWDSGKFKGIFDGQGHTIDHFQSTNGGLISELEQKAVVMNVTFENASVTNTGTAAPKYIGVIANRSDGVIKECSVVNARISGVCNGVGGIVGLSGGANEFTLKDYNDPGATPPLTAPLQGDYDITSTTIPASACVLNCFVGGNTQVRNDRQTLQDPDMNQVGCVGGIIGKTDGCAIENCRNEATVYGIRPGGIVGESQAGTIVRYCENYGTVMIPEDAATWPAHEPSLSSPNPGSIQYIAQNAAVPTGELPLNMGDVAVNFEVGAGGIIGVALSGGTTIQNCLNYGSVRSLFNTGGIAGLVLDSKTMIVNCGNDYKFGDEDYQSSLSGVYYVGGLIGYLYASEADGKFEHVGQYAATFDSSAALVYNSYNSMPLRTVGYFKGNNYTDGVFGGLVGRVAGTESKPSFENCHNATLPVSSDISNVSFSSAGSFVGLLHNTKIHIIHCFGVVNYEGVWNVIRQDLDQMIPGCINMTLLGTDYVNLPIHGGYYFDNSAYVLPQYVLDNLGLNETTVCGGILVDVLPGTAPAVYSVVLNQGALTGNDHVMEELQTYVQQYGKTSADGSGRHFVLVSEFLQWYCANQTHFMGGTLYCEEYAIFKSAGLMPGYTPIPIPNPSSNTGWEQPLPPGVIIVDPDDPISGLTPGSADSGISHSLTLDGDIGLNFYVDVPYPSMEAYAEFTIGNNNIQVPIDLEKYNVESGVKFYKFTYFVNASQLSMPVNGVVRNHVVLPDQGIDAWYESDPFSYSVNQYLEAIANHPYYQNQPVLMDLMRALSVYGFYANELLGTDPDFTQSVLFDDSDLDTITADALFEYQANMQDYGNAISYYGSSLLLQSKTSIKHYFTVDEDLLAMQGLTLDDFEFKCEGPDGEFDLTPVRNGNYYSVEIPNIESGHLGQNYTVRVLGPVTDPDVDPLAAEWNYSALSYAYTVLHAAEQGGNVSDAQVQLSQALAIYYNCAHAYFG